MLHIAGLLDTPDAGDVRLNGRSVLGLSDRARTAIRCHEVGFIYQFHHLLPEFSALENIMLPQLANGQSQKQAKSTASDLLEQMGLLARADHRPAALSGGEQQRVAFLPRGCKWPPSFYLLMSQRAILTLKPRIKYLRC